VKLGDQRYSFNRMDPMGMFFGLSADFAKIAGHLGDTEKDKLATAAFVALNRNLLSKSYLSGLVDFIDTINDTSTNKWTKWVNRQTGTLVPFSGFMNQVRKEVDPEVKEVWSMMDAVMARIPGLSKNVKPHVNLFGEDVVYEGGLGPDIASPVATMKESPEPAAKEIARLNIDLRHPLREIGGGGGRPGVNLTSDQYYRLMKLIGNETKIGGKGFKDAANEMVQSDFWNRLPDDPTQTVYDQSKEKVIRLMYEKYKQAGTMALLGEDEELRKRFMQNLRNSGNAIIGLPIEPIN
jgi:hypothetical protein